jgi:hypothetical protein
VDTGLGLLGLLLFCAAVIGLAAAVTWGVVKIDAIFRRSREAAPSSPEA